MNNILYQKLSFPFNSLSELSSNTNYAFSFKLKIKYFLGISVCKFDLNPLQKLIEIFYCINNNTVFY